MKSLSRIILVNWYLFESEEWDVRGHVALLGKNGSGKSSFIDALQLVMLGGNKSDWTPNAKATDKNFKRDIRSYSLGLVKDEEAVGKSTRYQPREDALTRVVLVFEDDETSEPISIGAAISARRDDPREQIEGFFILPGQSLRLDDLLEESKAGNVPKTYSTLKALFKHRAPITTDSVPDGDPMLYLFAHEPKLFMDQMLRVLGTRKRPPAVAKFRRAFKQSIKLSGLQDSVSDFVRQSILDAEPINLDNMRQSIRSLNNKKEAVVRANQKIAMLEKIEQMFRRAHKASQRRAGYAWCAAELEFSANDVQTELLQERLTDLAGEYSKTRMSLRETRAKLLETRDQLNDITTTIKSDNAESNRERLQERKNSQLDEMERVQNQINDIRQAMQFGSELARYPNNLDMEQRQAIDYLVRMADSKVKKWPSDSLSVDAAIQNALTKLPVISESLDDARGTVRYEIYKSREELADVGAKLDRISQGRSALSGDTDALIAVLADRNIKAVPICELVSVSDTHWQPAIEAYLRGNTEALVVDKADSRKAIDIYRGLKRHTHIGAIIVDSEKVLTWNDKPEKGTAAELIEGDNPVAVAYIRRLLRGIELHEDTNSILKSSRALGPDGAFQRSGGFRRLKLPNYTILGLGAAQSQIVFLEGRRDELIKILSDTSVLDTQFKNALQAADSLQHKLSGKQTVTQLVSATTSYQEQIVTLDKQINAIDTSHLKGLKRQGKKLSELVQQLDKEKDDLVAAKSRVMQEYRSGNRSRHELVNKAPALNAQRALKAQDDNYNAEMTDSLLQELEERHLDTNYEAMLREAQERSYKADKQQIENEEKAKGMLGQYLTTYPNDISSQHIDSAKGYRNEIAVRLHEIRDIGLHEREQEVADALYKVKNMVRSDLSIKLRSQIEQMKLRFNELNKELADRPFSSNQRYRFHYLRKSEYKEFLEFVEKVDNETVANIDGLFDEHPYINEVIERILDDDEGEVLGDYRNYYTYDIDIIDPESGIEERLSRKMGAASGGEHKTPFYVAMGASLAGAYRLGRREDGEIDGGISLYLADEAFEKMDYVNTMQAASYLKSIGLQLFVAAPDDAEAELRSFVDTVMFFIRDGEHAAIDVDYVTPRAQQLISETFGGPEIAN